MINTRDIESLQLNLDSYCVGNAPRNDRHLHDLAGCFHDEQAYKHACEQGNPLVYTVSSVTPESADGALHYGLGMIMPGRVGNEYYLTRGHLHAWRPAAEIYIGLSGRGIMLLEDEHGREARAHPLESNTIVYVPGNTAHRTVNTGNDPLAYLGIYPAKAGHDYGALKTRNFSHMVIAEDDGPHVRARPR